jgi:peptidoglycan/LPS O-acetylase OafA/YrhL
MTPTNRDQIPSLTGLRCFAAYSVVLAHAIPFLVKYEDPPLALRLVSQAVGGGMTLFFVLSGFVIFMNYSRSIGTRAGIWNFAVARFARLYPLFFLAVVYDLAMKYSYAQLPTLAALPYYATLTQSWLYTIIGGHTLIFQFGWLPQVTWSISTEWMFYFAFPAICAGIASVGSARGRLICAIGLSVFAIALVTAIDLNGNLVHDFGVRTFGPIAADPSESFRHWLLYFSPYIRIFEFALGCLVASISMRLNPPSSREERAGVFVTAVALAAIVGLHMLFFGWRPVKPYVQILLQVNTNYGFAPAMGLLIFCCARYRNGMVGFFANPWIVLGGEISYSVYLLHFLIIDAFRYEAATITTPASAIAGYLQLAIALAAITGLSLVSWRLIEVPCRRALRRALSVASDSAGLEIKPPLAVPLQTPRAPEVPGTPAH